MNSYYLQIFLATAICRLSSLDLYILQLAAICALLSAFFSKYIGPPLVVSLETGGGAYLQTLEKKIKKKQIKTNNNSKLSLLCKDCSKHG